MIAHTPISVGELVDKITILRIKTREIKDPQKLANVTKELQELNSVFGKLNMPVDILKQFQQLEDINKQLWIIEDVLREKERKQEFDDEFVQNARAVYFTNDERASIKKQINIMVGSDLVEEKSYEQYKTV